MYSYDRMGVSYGRNILRSIWYASSNGYSDQIFLPTRKNDENRIEGVQYWTSSRTWKNQSLRSSDVEMNENKIKIRCGSKQNMK